MQATLKQRNGELQNELDFHHNRAIPRDLAERLETNSQAQELAKREITKCKDDEKGISDKYDDYIKRFRTLKKKAQKH